MIQMDSIAYRSKIVEYSPLSKMAVGIVSLCLCIFFQTPYVALWTLLVMSVLTVYCANLTPLQYLNFLVIPVTFLFLGTLTIVVCRINGTEGGVAFFSFWGHTYGVTPASLRVGGGLILRALGAISCMYFVSLNTTLNDLMQGLRTLRAPELLIALMELIYRYIFVVFEEMTTMRIAQDSRLGYVNVKTRLRSFGELMGVLFLRSMARCDAVYIALQSRGYEGELKFLRRTYPTSYKLWLFGWIVCSVTVAVGLWERGNG